MIMYEGVKRSELLIKVNSCEVHRIKVDDLLTSCLFGRNF